MSSGKTTIKLPSGNTFSSFADAQGTTGTLSSDSRTLTFNVPTTYNGGSTARAVFSRANTGSQPSFSSSNTAGWWRKLNDFNWDLVVFGASTISAGKGSLNITINDSNNEPLDTFKAIPGDLDTSILANGDYADVAIPIIFEKLKNYVYPESIFGNIQCVLSAFFVSIALQQRISERIQTLVQKIIAGEINLEQFKELVQQGNEKFASEYGDNYVSNFVKLQIAIDKYKHML